MTIIIEIDRRFTFGVDWHKDIKGLRFGFVAVHWVPVRLEKFTQIMHKAYERGRRIDKQTNR